jgi:predicted GNAT superfamily acetyltransferase
LKTKRFEEVKKRIGSINDMKMKFENENQFENDNLFILQKEVWKELVVKKVVVISNGEKFEMNNNIRK